MDNNSCYKIEINFFNNDDKDDEVAEYGKLDRFEIMQVYAILLIKAKKLKERWLNDSKITLDVAEKQFDEYVEHFNKKYYKEIQYRWLENYLYDDETRDDLERKCNRLESIVKELQDKYDDDTYYLY